LAYRFKEDDVSVADVVRRIAVEQIDKAIGEIDDPEIDQRETVHQVRKRCKKLRGLVRLVRPALASYALENAAYRDAARELSFLRDTEALIETYDRVADAFDGQIDRPAFASIRRRLTLRQKEEENRQDIADKLDAFRESMVEAKVRALRWELSEKGTKAFAGGVEKTYGRGREAMKTARKTGDVEAFHDWRKRIKYHGHHARLLAPIWPGPMTAHHAEADALGKLLGDHHDLEVFAETLRAEPDAFGNLGDVEVFLTLMERRRAAIETEAFERGARLLAEPEEALAARWAAYFKAWRKECRKADAPALAA